MADKGFNGTVVSIAATALSNIRSVSFSNAAASVDVSSLSTTTKSYVNGQRDPSCTIRLCGQALQANCAVGYTGALSVTWFDNTSTPVTQNIIVTGHETSGDIDGAIETTITLKPQ